MHGQSGEKPNSPPEYPLRPYISIRVRIDFHVVRKNLFAPHGLAKGEVCVLVHHIRSTRAEGPALQLP